MLCSRIFISILLTILALKLFGQPETYSKVDSIVRLALSLSEEALYKAQFQRAKKIVETSYFQNFEGIAPRHEILLTIQDIRVTGFMNIVLAKRTDHKQNFERLKKLLPSAERLADRKIQGDYFLAWANAHRTMGNTDSSSIYLEKATSLFTEINALQDMAKIRAGEISRLHNRLLQENRKEDILKLIPRYEEEIAYSSIHSKYALAYNTRHLGQIYRRQTQDLEKALNLFETSLALRQDIGFKPFIPASYSSIGDVLLKMGNYPEAIKAYLKSAETAEEIGFIRYQSYPLMSIGDCYKYTQDEAGAIEFYLKALKKASSNNYSSGIDQAIKKIREIE